MFYSGKKKKSLVKKTYEKIKEETVLVKTTNAQGNNDENKQNNN